MAYGDDQASADPQPDAAADIDDVDNGALDADAIDIASTDLPAFLTDDEPAGVALNGAAA